MALYGNGCVTCVNLLATAWLCAYCCSPPAPRVILVPTTSLSNATVSSGAIGVSAVQELPLLAVSAEHMER